METVCVGAPQGASGKPHVAIRAIPVSGSTPRYPPTQAAKKCWIGPQLFPVPPAESPVDGAGAQWGRKDGPPDSYLEPLNPHGSPFFFGFQKPFFFPAGKKKWVLTVSPVLLRHRKTKRRGVKPHRKALPHPSGLRPATTG